MTQISSKKLFQRQTTLSEFGMAGQEKLQKTSVTIVGCGGLGSAAAIYLAASGVGTIHLIDFDVVAISNLHRQVFYATDAVGQLKSKILSDYIRSISPFVKVTYTDEAISKNNVLEFISTSEIVLDCTDNLPIKYLLNDACVIENKVLVYGSLYKFDGYVATFNHLNSEGLRTANLRDAFPEMPAEKIPNCSELGTLNTIVGIIGLMQANEVLKIITGIGKPLVNQLLIYNSLDNSQFVMKLKSTFNKEKAEKTFNAETYEVANCGIDESLEISESQLKKQLLEGSLNLKIISVIENEFQELPFDSAKKIPLSKFQNWIDKQDSIKDNCVLVCNRGIMSMTAVKMLKETFPNANAKSLKGGIMAF
ncbi:MAG: HesA/MoeB/ThiF family protein [Urechidicola sp.]|nr:HesA/MoeB/ThiF family protein [Urechidicola sp.]